MTRLTPWLGLILGAALAGAVQAQTAPPVPAPTAPAIPTQVGMVEQPCPPGSAGRDPETLAFAKTMVSDGSMDPKVMVAWAKGAAERAALDAWTAKNDWGDLCRYRQANASAKAGGAPVKVVFLGDSITELWQAADPDLFSHGVVDRGVSGQTSGQLLLRFEPDVVALHPKAVHILVGTNDVAGNSGPNRPEDLKNNIRAMVAIAKANHIAVILGAIPPAGSFSWRAGLHPAEQIRALNTWLSAFAKAQGATYVDYWTALAGPDGAMKPGYSRDGVHPLIKGYALMKPLAEKAMAKAAR